MVFVLVLVVWLVSFVFCDWILVCVVLVFVEWVVLSCWLVDIVVIVLGCMFLGRCGMV